MKTAIYNISGKSRRSRHVAEQLVDGDWYFEQYPDVAASGIAPAKHFMLVGWAEGRSPHLLFDTEWYFSQNPDVEQHGVNPLLHYVEFGWREGRNPHPLFDTSYYLENNADALVSGTNPLTHYLSTGWKEGRSPNALFSPKWYLATYPDVAASGQEPLSHYIRSGAQELRQAGPDFHTEWYAKQYPQLAATGVNLLRYHIEFGQKLGLHPNAFVEARIPDTAPTIKPVAPLQTKPTQKPQPIAIAKAPATLNKITPDAGALLYAPLDERGRPSYPRMRRGDGRRLAALRVNEDHRWFTGKFLEDFLAGLDNKPLLPKAIKRILVIGHDFALSTGVMRPLSHYLSALSAAGGVEITSLQLAKGADAMTVWNEVDVHDIVIVNSLPLFFDHENGFELLQKCGPDKCAIYLHETDFIFNRLEKERPEKYQAFFNNARNFNFLTVSKRQGQMLKDRFGITRTFWVPGTSPIDSDVCSTGKKKLAPNSPLRIVMAGTLQPRKGVTLFSQLADKANSLGLPWTFHWAGGDVGRSSEIYKSANVEFLGNLDGTGMERFLSQADVFLLSSEDDPFPLACLEALQMFKRIVAFKDTGTSEIISSLSGCAVYNEHTVDAAYKALETAIHAELDDTAYTELNELFSLRGFSARFAAAVESFFTPQVKTSDWAPAPSQRIAAIVHLYYHDLWNEIAACLENLRHLQPDLYVTLSNDKPRSELNRVRSAILKRWPQSTIIELPNQGMDVGPFVEVVRHIDASRRSYDLILKLHSKKSVAVSGDEHGSAWRQELYSGLASSRSDVDRIVSIFCEHFHIGMIAPKGMLLGKSSKDVAAGKILNAPNMELLGKRMGLVDNQQLFFRGTMFWARADDILKPIIKGNLSISDFEAGHQPDESRAHAMERLFACMTRSAGRDLFQYDRELPKPISLLRDKHVGEDIYIIAAGASAGLIDPSFFAGKTTIGVNRVFVKFPCTYAIFKEFANTEYEQELIESGATPITAQWDSGNIRQGKMRRNLMIFKRPEYYFYEHLENTRELVDLAVIDPKSDKLVVSYSTITSAIHLAAYMGARNIILVGHDCGLLDGQAVFDGYYKDMSVSPWNSSTEYAAWLNQIEAQTIAVRDVVKDKFGPNVISLNPFVNFGLEGHQYQR